MANKKLKGIIWPNLPNDTYLLDSGEVNYDPEETYREGSTGKALQNKAEVDGYYSNLTAGSAEQLLSTVTIEDEVPYLFRTSGGSADIGDREYINGIVGGTVAFNQLVLAYSRTHSSGVVISSDTDGMPLLNGTASSSDTSATIINVSSVLNHIYYLHCDNKTSYGSTVGAETVIKSAGSYIGFTTAIVSGTTYTNEKRKANIIDLTQMFGSTIADYIYSLEQATAGAGIAWFKKYFPKPYYAYNAGELMSVKGLVSHDMTGFNQWDEEWEKGYLAPSTGGNASSNDCIRSKNYNAILPNTSYYVKAPNISGVNCKLYFYDENKTFISWVTKLNEAFTAPTNARYLRFYMANQYGNTYNHDICINLSWDGERDGEYEPYQKWSYPLDSDLELRGIPKIENGNLYYDGDVYEPDGTVTRKYGIVDLSAQTWKYQSAWESWYTDYIADMRGVDTGAETPKFICDKYDTIVTNYGLTPQDFNGITSTTKGASGCRILVRNGSTTVAPTGHLVYELATPTTETADPYTNPQIVDDFGTEEYVSTNIVPVGHKTQYMPNLRAKLEMAPNSPNGNGDYIVRQTNGMNEYVPLVIEDALPTMPSAVGTYKLTVTVTDGSDPVLSWEAE